MITIALAEKHLKRMSGFDFFPAEAEAIKELRLAVESAHDEAVADAVVTDLIRNAIDRKCPTPADIWRAMRAANPRDVQEWVSHEHQFKTRCPDCGDTGFTSEDRDGIPVATRCSHPKRGKAAQESLALEANQEGTHGG